MTSNLSVNFTAVNVSAYIDSHVDSFRKPVLSLDRKLNDLIADTQQDAIK
jgi:hypothetical protein